MALSRKALNYDLDDRLLRKIYPRPKSYKNAWYKIKDYLCRYGFESRQYSGVISTKPMSQAIVQIVLRDLNSEYAWLAPCVKKFDVTSISKEFDMRYIFNRNS